MSAQTDIDVAIDIEYDRQILSGNLVEFFRQAWHIVEPATKLSANWHLDFISYLLQEAIGRVIRGEKRPYHIIINVPPRSSKSTLCTVMPNAWAWTTAPCLEVMNASYADSLAELHAIKTKEIVESEWYQKRWGHMFRMSRRMNRNKAYGTDKGGKRLVTSITGAATGKGAHVLIIDDPNHPLKSESATDRNKVNSWLSKTMYTRLNRPEIDLVIIIQQRVHEDDATGHLIRNAGDLFRVFSIPAEDTFPIHPPQLGKYYRDGLMDPVRFNHNILRDQAKVLGSRGYAGQYGQQPASPDGNILKRSWFRIITREDYEKRVPENKRKSRFVADTAYDEADKIKKNDPSGILAYVVHEDSVYVIGWKKYWDELPDLVRNFEAFVRAHRYTGDSILKIEPKASGKSVVQTMRRYTSINVAEAKAPKDSKEVRVTGISPFCESLRVILVQGDWNDAFIDELCVFPGGAHDEAPDCLVMAVEDAQRKPISHARIKS